MNKIGTSKFLGLASNTVGLLTMVLAVAGNSASAKGPKPKEPSVESQVVAHLSFSGVSAFDMAMQRKVNDKYYLYVQHSQNQGISIIDISVPSQPKAIAVIPWPDPAVSSRMNVAGDLAIIAETGELPMRSRTSYDDLVIWDLSNPTAPRVVHKFSRVVKWLQDERNFIYVLNGDGLWVVSKPAEAKETQSSGSYGG
jgi:hypothetical protein